MPELSRQVPGGRRQQGSVDPHCNKGRTQFQVTLRLVHVAAQDARRLACGADTAQAVAALAKAHPGARILICGSLYLAGREFIPTLDEGDIAMQALRVPSASLEQSLAMQMAIERAIAAQPEVKTIFARTGTAEAAVDPMPPNISDAVIILKDHKEWPDPRLEKEELIARFEELASAQQLCPRTVALLNAIPSIKAAMFASTLAFLPDGTTTSRGGA